MISDMNAEKGTHNDVQFTMSCWNFLTWHSRRLMYTAAFVAGHLQCVLHAHQKSTLNLENKFQMHGPFDTYNVFNLAASMRAHVIAHLCMRSICMSPMSAATLSQYRSIVLEFQRCLQCFHSLSLARYGSFHSISFDCSHGWLGLSAVTTWERFNVPPLPPFYTYWSGRRRWKRNVNEIQKTRRNAHVYINWRGCCCCCCWRSFRPSVQLCDHNRLSMIVTHTLLSFHSRLSKIAIHCSAVYGMEVHAWSILCVCVCEHASPLVSVFECFIFTHLILLSIIGKNFLFVIWTSVEIDNRFFNRQQPIHANAKVDRPHSPHLAQYAIHSALFDVRIRIYMVIEWKCSVARRASPNATMRLPIDWSIRLFCRRILNHWTVARKFKIASCSIEGIGKWALLQCFETLS